MKLKNTCALLIASLGLTACSSFLDFDESQGMNQEEAYAYFDNVTRMASGVYRSVPADWGKIGDALREAATDNAVYTWESNAVWNMYNGTWSPIRLVDDRWGEFFQVLHDANSFLENYSEENLERFKWDKSYAENLERVNGYYKEVEALRAFYHFELAKRYGDVPLMTRTYSLEEINHIEKTAFADVIEYVNKELERLAPELPLDQNDMFHETGHMTKGIALAIRSRALLYAASPFFAGEGDATAKWEAAAKAAYDVIALNRYSLSNIKEDPLYNKAGGNLVLDSKQLIWEVRGTESNTFEARNLPMGFEGAKGGNTPTQNFVDEFDFLDGTPFDWENPLHVAKMFYDKSGNPTRDPRLYLNVICDGMKYMNTAVEPLEGGKNGLPIEGATRTGYYLRKLMNETVTLDPVKPAKKPHHYPTYRYAEILLNYAEALNEWQGPATAYAADGGRSLTALDALNEVREAAGMPAYDTTDKDEFRKLVRKERRIELAFEDHRYWDIRRWKEGKQVEKIYGLKKVNGVYQKALIQNRIWDDKMYLYPIPQNETFMNKNLTQNPGW